MEPKFMIISSIVFVFLFIPSLVYATKWTVEREVTQHTEKNQILPTLLEGSNDTLNLLWWNDENQIFQIFYSKLNKYGKTLIPSIPLFQPHTTNIRLASAIDDENNIHVVWAKGDIEIRNNLYQLFYIKISDNGTVLINPKPIATSDPELSSFLPYLTYKDNILYLAYEQFNISGRWETKPHVIYFVKLNKTGSPTMTDKRITDTSLISVGPRIFVDSENNVNIVYTRRENNYGSNGDAYFTKLDNDGNFLISDKLILDSTWVVDSIGDTYDNIHLLIWNDNGNYAKIDKYGNILVLPKNLINGGYLSFFLGSAGLDSENNINLIVLLNKDRPGFVPNLTYIKMNETGILEYENITTTIDDGTQTSLLIKQDDDSKHIVYGRRTYVFDGSWDSYYSFYYRNTLPPESPTLYSPLNNSITNNNNITFYWSESFGSTSYKLQYSANISFIDENTATISNITKTFYEKINMSEGIYWWRVTVNNSVGESNYSDIFAFIIDLCIPNWTLNNTWGECQPNNMQYKNYYDSNDCNEFETQPSDTNQSCDYCTPNWYCIEYSDCQINDEKYCIYVSDSNNCFNQTNLPSDKYSGNYSEFDSIFCDYCTPDWQEVNTTCEPDDTIIGYFIDINNCYNQTGLPSDLSGQPQNISYSCDYCTPEWILNGTWSECLLGGIQYTNYYDNKTCNEPETKPSDINQSCVHYQEVINTTANQTKNIDAFNETDTILELFTTANLTETSINLTKHSDNPTNATVGILELGKYIEIEYDEEMKDNLGWIMIKMYYTDEDVSNAGIDESTLRMYYYNESTSTWEVMPDSGVDTTTNYVWGNTTHLSFFGLFGNAPPTPTTTVPPAPTVTGGGGGGGGITTTTTLPVTTTTPSLTTTVTKPVTTTTVTKTEAGIPTGRAVMPTGRFALTTRNASIIILSSVIILVILAVKFKVLRKR